MSAIMEKDPWMALEGLSETYFFVQFSLERQLFKPQEISQITPMKTSKILHAFIFHIKDIPDEPKEIVNTIC